MIQNVRSRSVLDALPDNPLAESLVIGLLVLGACILGIHTRLVFSLASIWPANAMLLGILLLRPQANRPLTWLASAAAFLLADAMSGSELFKSVLLNGSNLATAAFGLITARLIGCREVSGNRPRDAMAVVVVLVGGAAGSSLTGAYIGPTLFGLDWTESVLLWFPSEFVNLAIFVPVLLALGQTDRGEFRLLSRTERRAFEQFGALASLLASIGLMHLIGGPGASSYVVPSLLWCAISFRPFATSLIVMATCAWILIAAPLGLIPLNIDIYAAPDASSFRLGVSMISIGMFVVSVINAAWRNANEQLQHIASHDSLTGLMNRGAFMQKLGQSLNRPDGGKTCLLMIDIDHFKVVNDTYGHPVGDLVLQKLANALVASMRQGSTVGRLGGEEFAVIVEGSLDAVGMGVAQRIQARIRDLVVVTTDGDSLMITASIGLAEAHPGTPPGHLLIASDSALYAAKHGGRDRIVSMGDAPLPELRSHAPHTRLAEYSQSP